MTELESKHVVGPVRRDGHVPAKVHQLHTGHVVQRKLVLEVRRVLDNFLRRQHLSIPSLLQKCQEGLRRLLLLFLNTVVSLLLLGLLIAGRSLLLLLRQILQGPVVVKKIGSSRVSENLQIANGYQYEAYSTFTCVD